jgi:hypothetical protein
VKSWLSKIYAGTAASFGLAVIVLALWTVLIIENKPVPSMFQYLVVGLTGIGGAIASSGGGSSSSSS